MRIKQYKGHIFGADLTAKEQKAMDIEIKKQIAALDKKYQSDVDIVILYTLAATFGFGQKRLRRFYDAVQIERKKMLAQYEMPEEDAVWLAEHLLKRIGVDVRAWNAEKEGKCEEK